MNTTFKTLILAAAGAALIAASPASAQTQNQKRVQRTTTAPMMLQVPPSALWTYGEITPNPRVDPYAQIRDEYLKDAPSHNGNSY